MSRRYQQGDQLGTWLFVEPYVELDAVGWKHKLQCTVCRKERITKIRPKDQPACRGCCPGVRSAQRPRPVRGQKRGRTIKTGDVVAGWKVTKAYAERLASRTTTFKHELTCLGCGAVRVVPSCSFQCVCRVCNQSKKEKRINVHGVLLSYGDACKLYGVSLWSLYNRIASGMSPFAAVSTPKIPWGNQGGQPLRGSVVRGKRAAGSRTFGSIVPCAEPLCTRKARRKYCHRHWTQHIQMNEGYQ